VPQDDDRPALSVEGAAHHLIADGDLDLMHHERITAGWRV
jgi:hypothetical protein